METNAALEFAVNSLEVSNFFPCLLLPLWCSQWKKHNNIEKRNLYDNLICYQILGWIVCFLENKLAILVFLRNLLNVICMVALWFHS